MDYKNYNDYEQLYLISEKDEEASSIIYEKYKPIVYSLAKDNYDRLIDYDVDLEELAQEGYIGLSKAIETYKDNMNASFYTFATICIDRSIKTFCRRFQTKKQRALNNKISIDLIGNNKENLIELQEKTSSSKNPNTYLDNSYYNDLCIKFKNELSETTSCIFELRYNGFNNKEICNLLDIPFCVVRRGINEMKKKSSKYLNN